MYFKIRRKHATMEKGPSWNAKYWTSPENEVEHFKHAEMFGLEGYPYKYSKKAVEFLNAESDSIISFKANEKKFHSIYKYNVATNEFMIISKHGKIVTYYTPSKELRYFYSRFKLYGDYWIKRDYSL